MRCTLIFVLVFLFALLTEGIVNKAMGYCVDELGHPTSCGTTSYAPNGGHQFKKRVYRGDYYGHPRSRIHLSARAHKFWQKRYHKAVVRWRHGHKDEGDVPYVVWTAYFDGATGPQCLSAAYVAYSQRSQVCSMESGYLSDYEDNLEREAADGWQPSDKVVLECGGYALVGAGFGAAGGLWGALAGAGGATAGCLMSRFWDPLFD